MKIFVKLLILFITIFSQSCEKDTEQIDLESDINITNIACYPNDSISMTFLITSTGGDSPFMYNWINPSYLDGNGPFTINITSNLILELEVIDANKTKINFQYEIQKDTIDPLKYDYRNPFVGFYDCEVKHRWAEDSSGVYITHQKFYKDTIEVRKDDDFEKINIANTPNLNFNFMDFTFEGYHFSGSFYNDSIRFFYYISPVGLSNYTYRGKKILNSTY